MSLNNRNKMTSLGESSKTAKWKQMIDARFVTLVGDQKPNAKSFCCNTNKYYNKDTLVIWFMVLVTDWCNEADTKSKKETFIANIFSIFFWSNIFLDALTFDRILFLYIPKNKNKTYVGLVSAMSPLVSPGNTFQNLIVANTLLF